MATDERQTRPRAIRRKTRTAKDSGGDRRSPDLSGMRRRESEPGRAPEPGDRTAGREAAPQKPPSDTSS